MGVGLGLVASGGYNFLRGLILGGQFIWPKNKIYFCVTISFILLLIKWSEMDLIQFSYVIVMNFKGGGWVGKVLIHHTILKTQSTPAPPSGT